MKLNISVWILFMQFWPLNSAKAGLKFNVASGHNCWLSSVSTVSFSAVSELLCSMRCSTTGWESFQFENGTCEVLKAHWPTDDMVRYKEYGNTTELEVARHKPISASPNYGSNLPPLAVDGDITTFYHSATNLNTPWIMVDLGGGFLVTKVRILPRDYVDYSHRFMDAQVLVGEVEPITPGNFSQFTVVGTIDGPIMPVDWRDFEVLPARCSRYVAIYKNIAHPRNFNLMELAEMEVYSHY